MALVQQSVLDKIEIVTEHKVIQCRHDNRIVDDETGEIVSQGNYHRHVLCPGDDLSNEPADVQAIGTAMWTPAIIAGWDAYMLTQKIVIDSTE
jgi:hypothetical protein